MSAARTTSLDSSISSNTAASEQAALRSAVASALSWMDLVETHTRFQVDALEAQQLVSTALACTLALVPR